MSEMEWYRDAAGLVTVCTLRACLLTSTRDGITKRASFWLPEEMVDEHEDERENDSAPVRLVMPCTVHSGGCRRDGQE